MLRADFHAHTCHCDGRDTPRKMVEAAVQMGLTDFGLSGHADFPYGWDGGMTDEAFAAYRGELLELREEFKGIINLYIGVELDAIGPLHQRAEYAIGSVHCIPKNGEYVMVDDSDAVLTDAVLRLWDGDWYGMVRDYYELVGSVCEKTGCDWVGHFDLVTKFNQGNRLFDEKRDGYLEPALAAMRKLNDAGLPFEINTGAISRGYRREPYPSKVLLKELRAMGGRIIINSDSHRCDTICYRFDEAVRLAKECGFTKTCVLRPEGGFGETAL